MSVLDAFTCVAIINLPHRTDRLREMGQQLARVGMGMDDVMVVAGAKPDDPGAFPSIGARGCFESHLKTLDLAVTIKVPSLLILEDDCDFVGNEAPPHDVDWDIFYGGHNNEVQEEGPTIAAPDTAFTGTHCIGLRGEAIRLARDYLKAMHARPAGDPMGGPMHVDGAYSWFRREHPELKTLVANIAVQRPSRSDVADLKWFDRLPLVRTGATALRQLTRR